MNRLAMEALIRTAAHGRRIKLSAQQQAHPAPLIPLSDLEMAQEVEWVYGFISAFNFYRETGNVANGTDMSDALASTDNYCAAHPLDKIAWATNALIVDLSQQAHP